jgi:NAD(P)-dependent dehydrogenase (short-subunit alcohol dehydrogenase family)
MELTGKVIVVTGGASGIGKALCERFAADKPRAIWVVDRDGPGAEKVAAAIGGRARTVDVRHEAEIAALVRAVEEESGRIDLFCSNAGVAIGGDENAPDADWQLAWEVNLMAHVYAARAVLPGMLARGGGTLLQTCSAAGLLTNIGAAPYAVTKHAAVAFAEWLSVTYRERGLRVSILCPMGVATPMLAGAEADPATRSVTMAGKVLPPSEVAEVVVAGLAAEKFWILPHPEVARFVQHKAGDVDGWLGAMAKFRSKVLGSAS